MLRNRIRQFVITVHLLQGLFIILLRGGDLLRWELPEYTERPLWSVILLLILSCCIVLYLVNQNIKNNARPEIQVILITIVPMCIVAVILWSLWKDENILSFLWTVLVAFPSFFVVRFVINLFSKKQSGDQIVEWIKQVLPMVVLALLLLFFSKGNLRYPWALSLFIASLFLYSSLIIFLSSFFTANGRLIAVLKSLLLIPLSILMFYFSGQSVALLNGFNPQATDGQIWECFYNIYYKEYNVYDSARFQNNSIPKRPFVYPENSILRNSFSGDSVPLGSYTNHFFTREYYLSKNNKMTVLRGFGFLFNLPDDDHYLLNK